MNKVLKNSPVSWESVLVGLVVSIAVTVTEAYTAGKVDGLVTLVPFVIAGALNWYTSNVRLNQNVPAPVEVPTVEAPKTEDKPVQ